jgi:hypothetical protein
MDHTSPQSHCCAEKRRKAEPYIFFFGTMLLVAFGIALVVCNSRHDIGPRSAQPAGASQAP